MIVVTDSFRELEEGQYENLTLEECEILVEYFPNYAAILTQRILRERGLICGACGYRFKSYSLTEVESGDLLCDSCTRDWIFGL